MLWCENKTLYIFKYILKNFRLLCNTNIMVITLYIWYFIDIYNCGLNVNCREGREGYFRPQWHTIPRTAAAVYSFSHCGCGCGLFWNRSLILVSGGTWDFFEIQLLFISKPKGLEFSQTISLRQSSKHFQIKGFFFFADIFIYRGSS